MQKKKILTILLFSVLTFLATAFFNTAKAQDLLPDPIKNIFGLMGKEGAGTSGFVTSRIQLMLLLALGGIILVSVIYAGLASYKYIKSQGDPGQIEEAGKAVKAIFLGIAVLFVGIIGIVLVFVFFGADFFKTSVYQVCLSAPNSVGCAACNAEDGGLADNWDTVSKDAKSGVTYLGNEDNNNELCTMCESEYVAIAAGHIDVKLSDKCKEPISQP